MPLNNTLIELIENLNKSQFEELESKIEKLKTFYNARIDSNAIFCTDTHKGYVKMAKELNLQHKQILGKKYVNGI